MEAIIRLALTDDGGKWEPGTVLAAYPIDEKLGPGEKGEFLCIKTDVPSIVEARRWRLKKKFPLDKVISSIDLDKKVIQKQQIRQKVIDKKTVTENDVHEKPDLTTLIDNKLIADTPESQWPKETDIEEKT